MNYRSEIDGLRAFAVLPVILFHADFGFFSGGYIGVDIFFVISGYLITSIIVSDLEDNRFSILKFYLRRARRLLPALYLVMLSSIVIAWLWLPNGDMKSFSQSIVSSTLFSSNILFWLQSGYFDTSAELKPMLHTWSLAVEEQYYFLVPVLLVCLWKFGKIAYLLSALAILSVASLLCAAHFVELYPNSAFFFLHTRFWELGIGAVLAVLIRNRKTMEVEHWRGNILSFIGFIAIVLSVFLFDRTTPTPSFYTLIPTIGTALIIAYAVPNTVVNNILRWKPIVFIGLISYSLYLWHQPVIAFARHRFLGDISDITVYLFPLIFALAYFSWRFVEKPARSASFSNVVFIPLTIMTSLLLLAFGVFGHQTSGFKNRDISYLEVVQNISLGNYNHDNKYLRAQSWTLLKPPKTTENEQSLGDLRAGVTPFNLNDKREKMLIVGDSHSKVSTTSSTALKRLELNTNLDDTVLSYQK